MLDANVLMPQVLRDVLLWAAYTGLFRPFWSIEVLAEVQRNLGRVARLTPEQVMRVVNVMRDTFPAAMVPVWPGDRLATLRNDQKDRHVLGVAIESGARYIVTQNIRHFRPPDLLPHDIEAVLPDDFLIYLLQTQPVALASALDRMSRNMTRPHLSPVEIVTTLGRLTPRFSAAVMETLR